MSEYNLPPIPQPGETGPQVCEIVRLYLAIMDDLAPQQTALLSEHVNTCPDCAATLQQLQQTTHLVASGLAQTTPSPRVDRAIMAALASSNMPVGASAQRSGARINPSRPAPIHRSRRPAWLVGSLATAAVLVVALFTALFMNGLSPVSTGRHTFSLPQSLSWSSYVLYHSETGTGKNGTRYNVYTYDNLGMHMMHVETVGGSLDVVAVADEKSGEVLGMDMKNHVAQWGADQWMVDDSAFDLEQLRHDLATNSAIYLNKDTFQGQPVYCIRLKNGLVLLLNMQYQPVNVLQGVTGPGTGKPMYQSLKLMPSSQVPGDMWNMSVPANFHMGTLPPKP
ncbi:MAG TPA: hypothetical protein VFA09_23340 [Ktedonobacteraceae bacterium]|nr:hypothetical protein [Ktedonobacteraceae bacterium]